MYQTQMSLSVPKNRSFLFLCGFYSLYGPTLFINLKIYTLQYISWNHGSFFTFHKSMASLKLIHKQIVKEGINSFSKLQRIF